MSIACRTSSFQPRIFNRELGEARSRLEISSVEPSNYTRAQWWKIEMGAEPDHMYELAVATLSSCTVQRFPSRL